MPPADRRSSFAARRSPFASWGPHFPFDSQDAPLYTDDILSHYGTITSPARRTATRSSFLERLKNWADQKSWRHFIAVYGRVIRASALKAGLRSEEADDVVQETLLSVARSIPGFVYDRSKGTFEAWVRRIAQCRVADHLRQRGAPGHPLDRFPGQADFSDRTDANRLSHSVDPFAERWETAWRESALLAGMERLKHSTSAAHYQIFHMCVIDRIDESEIARILGVQRATVYLVRHRLGRKLRQEIERFRKSEPPGS